MNFGTSENRLYRLIRASLAGTLAFLLVVGLSMLFARLRALAQPAAEGNEAILNVEKTVNADVAAPGDMLTYTIRIWNTGDEGAPAWLTDTLDSQLTYVTDSLTTTASGATSGFENGVITWSHPNLVQAWITFSVEISPEITYAEIVNTAQVTGAGHLIESSAQTSVQQTYPHLEAVKSVTPDRVRPGGYLTYTVGILNTGDRDVETVWMTDTLPPLVTYVTDSLTATMGTFDEAGGVITWNATLGPAGALPLPPGEQAAITFTVQISPELTQSLSFTNTAEITGAGTLIEAQAKARAMYHFYAYLPIIYRRWPPLPYAPVLFLDDPEVGINDYIISWSHDHPDVSVTSYILEEASNASFTDAVEVYSGPATEKEIIDQPDGTYYYRVMGHNQYGYGAWSNIESVTVFTVYYDNFDDSNSGWPNEKGPIKDDRGVTQGYWYRRYRDGQYQILIQQPDCWTCGWFYQPDALAPFRPPTNKYCIETRVKFENGAYWANMGVVFGANEGNSKLYALCMSRGGDPDKLGWFLMRKDDYNFPKRGCSGPTWKIADTSRETDSSREGWNSIRIGVDGDKVRVYMGGNYKGQWTMNGLSNMTRVGVIGGDYEILPVEIRYSYFRVIPNSDCSTQ